MSITEKNRLKLACIANLLRWEFLIRLKSFGKLYCQVSGYSKSSDCRDSLKIDQIVDAFESVKIWYWKRVMCFQHSCCLLWLLRDAGFPAKMTIGAQHWPPRTHAWVTVNGVVVGDREDYVKTFDIIDTI